MNKTDEAALFEFLARQSKLREWLAAKLTVEMNVLVQMGDIDQLRRAQGRAQVYQQIQALMDSATRQ